ncbi:MAG: phenylacetate--CoA ligase family protein [Acidimicrobiales bacterium]
MAGRTGGSVSRYLRQEVVPHSAYYRDRLGPALASAEPRGQEELYRLPFTRLDEVDDPTELVLRPDWAGGRPRGRRETQRGAVERAYKPIHWVLQAGMAVGYSAADLEVLAGLGARWLGLAGLGPDDILVSILPPGPHLGWWQLALGARQAGISALHLPPVPSAEAVAAFYPSVLAGRPFDLARLLDEGRARGHLLDDVDTLLVVGELLEPTMRARLTALLPDPDAAVVSAWAPPGVRALWGQCRYADAYHTWPDTEVVEIVDPLSGEPAPPGADGEVVWTAVGWRGTVLVRLRTGEFALPEEGVCPACGTPSRRLSVSPSTPAFLAALDQHAGVAGWQAELRRAGMDEELVVFLVPTPGSSLGPLLADLDAELSAVQYVVVDVAALDARIAAHGDRRVVDLRA